MAVLALFHAQVAPAALAMRPVGKFCRATFDADIVPACPAAMGLGRVAMQATVGTVAHKLQVLQAVVIRYMVDVVDNMMWGYRSMRLLPYQAVLQHKKARADPNTNVSEAVGFSSSLPLAVLLTGAVFKPMAVITTLWVVVRMWAVSTLSARHWCAANFTGLRVQSFRHTQSIPNVGG